MPNQMLVGFLANVSVVPVWWIILAEKGSLISCWSTKTSLVSATARCLLALFCCAAHYADYLKRENKPMRTESIRWQIMTNDDFQTSRRTLCRCVVVQICPLFDLHGVMTFLSPDKRHFATGWSGQKEIDQVLSRGTAPTQCAQSKALYSKWVEWVRLSGGRLRPAGAHTVQSLLLPYQSR